METVGAFLAGMIIIFGVLVIILPKPRPPRKPDAIYHEFRERK